MLKIDLYVDDIKLVVNENPKKLSKEAKLSLYDIGKKEELDLIEFKFKDENGEDVNVLVPIEEAIWSS